MSKIQIGFIGQGFIGKNYADDFEKRGHSVVRFAKEPPHHLNDKSIRTCNIVFIAVPTPTTPKGFDASILRNVISFTKPGATVVIKSTILPGFTKSIQSEFPNRIIMHSPEFLSEATASRDASKPFMNIVGITKNNPRHKKAAELVLSLLPEAPFSTIVSSTEAEIIKYSHNCSGYTQIIFFNLMYDLADKLGADWKNVQAALLADPYVPNRYSSPVHKSGRGAGGNCFIKDMAALSRVYKAVVKDMHGINVLKSMELKNIKLLKKSKKDLALLQGVYGKS
jgi:UDPglucose 6-dehydrogenase